MEENIIVIRDLKTFFYFDFDWPKDVGQNLNHESEFIIKNNESLAKNTIKKQDWINIDQIEAWKQYS